MPQMNEAIVTRNPAGHPPAKLLRIVAGRDGSFSIAAPYHPAKTGIVFKVEAPVIVSPDGTGPTKMIDPHRVDVPVKMSFHASGFVQFSSVGPRPIRSGRGNFFIPKGLGIQARSILDP